MSWAIRHICRADSVYYERNRVRDVFSAALASAPENKAVILSHENFALYESKDKGMLAQRLRELMPDAKVFFTLRRCGRTAVVLQQICRTFWVSMQSGSGRC